MGVSEPSVRPSNHRRRGIQTGSPSPHIYTHAPPNKFEGQTHRRKSLMRFLEFSESTARISRSVADSVKSGPVPFLFVGV